MNKRLLIVAPLALLVCVFSQRTDLSAQVSSSVSVDILIEEALDKNPGVQRAYHQWKAAGYRIRDEKSLPDPMASYTYFGANVETRVGPQEHKYGLSQKVPFPGKLGLKGKVQSKRAEMLEEKYEAAKREVTKEVKLVYYDISWVDKAIQIAEEEKSILESLDEVARRRYESNLSPQQDVIKAQVELSKLIDKLLLLRQNRLSLTARMNSILNRPSGTEIGSLGEVDLTEFPYTLSELQDISKQSSEDLRVAQIDIERAEYEESLARADYLPDLTLGFDHIQVGSGHTTMPNDGQDAWMGTVAISVPLWFDKLAARLDEKKALLEAGKMDYQSVENVLSSEIEDLYYKVTTYKDIISLYETALLPQTETAFEAAQAGYEAGKADFLNWLDAQRILLQTKLAYHKAIVDYQKSIAYLERVVGKDLLRRE